MTVDYAPGQLKIEVRDDGVGTASGDGLGHGLVGIRERVKIYGGEMTAGPAPSGGFLLSARLPIREDTPMSIRVLSPTTSGWCGPVSHAARQRARHRGGRRSE